MKLTKKIIALFLCAGMILSMTACGDNSKEDVIAAADEVASTLADLDADGLADLSTEIDEGELEALSILLDFDNFFYSEDKADVISTILGTITYTVDEKSAQASKKSGEGSVNVVFTMVDYESVLADEENTTDVDTCVAAIEACAGTIEISTTFEFVLADDEWLFDSFDSVTADLYEDVVMLDISFVSSVSSLNDAVDHTEWFAANDGDSAYLNTSGIELDIVTTEEGWDTEFEFYYEVEFDGSLVFTSDTCTDSGYYIEAYFSWYDDGATLDANGEFLADGSYTITFYDLAGNELASDTCTVTTGEVEPITGSSEAFQIFDSEYSEAIEDMWWWYDNTSLELDLVIADDYNDTEFNYTYTVEYNGTIVYTSDEFTDVGFYIEAYFLPSDIDLEILEAGTYTITFYTLSGTPIASGTVELA